MHSLGRREQDRAGPGGALHVELDVHLVVRQIASFTGRAFIAGLSAGALRLLDFIACPVDPASAASVKER